MEARVLVLGISMVIRNSKARETGCIQELGMEELTGGVQGSENRNQTSRCTLTADTNIGHAELLEVHTSFRGKQFLWLCQLP